MERFLKLLALTAGTAVAFAVGSASAEESKVTVVKAAGLDTMKVVRDKDTGKLRAATSEEIVEMSASGSRLPPSVLTLSRPTTTVVTRADGSGTVRRSLDDLDSLVATRTADGKVVLRHGGTHAAPATQQLPKE
jgi:ABC-type Na+ efflux pump permease subunit